MKASQIAQAGVLIAKVLYVMQWDRLGRTLYDVVRASRDEALPDWDDLSLDEKVSVIERAHQICQTG